VLELFLFAILSACSSTQNNTSPSAGNGAVGSGGNEMGAAGSSALGNGGSPVGGSAGAGVGGSAASGGSAGTAATAGGATGLGGMPTGGAGAGGSSNGGLLSATPPMGWNSWNKFESAVSETVIKQIADVMVSSGMKDAGYEYVNIDDTWQASTRDAGGKLQADATRFAGGIQALADYVHGQGLKLGIYSDRGSTTCAGMPGSGGHETDDAATFAAWGVDYLKYDNCNADSATMQVDYTAMGKALKASGRPIVYSICGWGFYDWEPSLGQLWRTTTDIGDTWDVDGHSILSLLDINGTTDLAAAASPGHWNDPDMLEVGNGGMTDTEYRSHFSLWAMMAAPLIAGNDLRTMTSATKDILTNSDVIAVDQDPLGKQGVPLNPSSTLEVWSKPLSGTATYAVVLLNRTDTAADISVTFSDLGITSGMVSARDLWSHTDLGPLSGSYTASAVPSHGVAMLEVTGM
jgi:alpha-galactosidase